MPDSANGPFIHPAALATVRARLLFYPVAWEDWNELLCAFDDAITYCGRGEMRKIFTAVSMLLLLVGVADAAEVSLISTGDLKQALDKIIADYTKETGNQVKYIVGNPLIVWKKLVDGDVFDVVVQSAPAALRPPSDYHVGDRPCAGWQTIAFSPAAPRS
jgi:hypothetical protein